MWAALAGAGLCHDGLRDDTDEGGAGLWPLGIHNWLARSSSRQEAPDQPRAFTSFGSGFHQRLFSVHDVLSKEELEGARFFRRNCRRPYLALAQVGTPHWLDMSDRLSRGILMRDLLLKAGDTLKKDRVRGRVVLETRLFDLDLALVRLAKIKARQESGLMAQAARQTGVSEPAIVLAREEAIGKIRELQFTQLLRNSLDWNLANWLALALNRRIALYREAQEQYRDEVALRPKLHRLLLQNVDVAIAKGDGRALNMWLGFATPPRGKAKRRFDNLSPRKKAQLSPTVRETRLAITEGERGEKLLSLSPKTGFRERSVVALRRGIAALSRGESIESMRAFALAMKHSEESRRPDAVHRLTKRWFAYVLSQHSADDEVLAILNNFVSPIDRNEMLEVLLWRAAFHADNASFEKIAFGIRKGGSLDRRVEKLRLLSKGDVTALMRLLHKDLAKRPNSILRFMRQTTRELATENLEVRENNKVVLTLAMELLGQIVDTKSRGLARRANAQIEEMQTLLDGLEEFDQSATGRARQATPGAEAYAGTVRLAPADPLPWPFGVSNARAPSPFSPVHLRPVEWREKDGTIVYGWQVHE